MHRDTTAPLEPDDGWTSIFEHVLAIGSKDLAHAIELADRLGVEVPMAQYASEHLAEALGLESSEVSRRSERTDFETGASAPSSISSLRSDLNHRQEEMS